MKVDRILYQKIFPTGMMYLNQKIGVEVQVDPSDNIDEVFRLAKETVEQWNLESNPSYAAAMEYMKGSEIHINPEYASSIKENPVQSKESAIESHIKTINECKTLNNLKIFEKLVSNTNDPSLTEAYNSKLKSFQ